MAQEERQSARIVVTGIGAVTAHGIGAERLWEAAKAGTVAIRPVKNLPMEGYRTTLGGEVTDHVAPGHEYWPGSGIREPALDFALVAAGEAMADSGLRVGAEQESDPPTAPSGVPCPAAANADPAASIPAGRWGVVFGSCNGGLVNGERALRDELSGGEADHRRVLLVPPQAMAEALAAAFGLRGPVMSVNTACASGAHAIAHAAELIRSGAADAMLVGGADSLSAVTFAGFNCLESLAVEPAAPYSRDRDGLSLGEGGGMLVLTRMDVAEAAGAEVLAEFLGYGLSADGYHPTAPHPQGEGATRAITAALAAAGVDMAEIGYINGHGTGTMKNDPAEVQGIKTALGDAARTVRMSSTKSMIGHLLGAAGAVEGIVTILALRDQVAPPTAGFTGPDPQCDLDVVPTVAKPLNTQVALSNNFAFAGANASLVFARPGRARGPAVVPPPEPVVITGMAALSAAGTTVAELWDAHVTGAEPGTAHGGLRSARVEVNPADYIPARQRRRMDRLGLLALIASQIALTDAGLDGTRRPAPRIGVVLGTGLGPMESMELFTTPLVESGPSLANPAIFPNVVYNAAAGQVAMRLGLTGVTSTITVTHAAGAAALCVARDLLRRGAADAIVVPAADVLSPAVLTAYRRFPRLARQPYTLAEGGFALVLERLTSARARGAPIEAELSGYGIASDARGIGAWDPRGRGLEAAMRAALTMARTEPGALSAVWANAAGLASVDRAERAALDRIFGGRGPRVEAPKQRLGEPVGAGAHLSAILAVTGRKLGGAAGPVLVNSSSLGGTHIAVVLDSPKERP